MISRRITTSVLLWTLAGLISIALTTLMFLPANWMSAILEAQSGGRLTLGDAQGTLWKGSAFVGGAYGRRDPVTPLLPGRFSWRLSPLLLLGIVNAKLENPESLSQAVMITGSWRKWHVSPSMVTIPAERLAALGAPLNTIQPSGQMKLSWSPLQLVILNGTIDISGSMQLAITNVASRLSAVKPLGDYNLSIDCRGQQASLTLRTDRGPMLLNGSGTLDHGTFKFSGTAEAENVQDERLANFLNLLGPHRNMGNKDVIVLEYK